MEDSAKRNRNLEFELGISNDYQGYLVVEPEWHVRPARRWHGMRRYFFPPCNGSKQVLYVKATSRGMEFETEVAYVAHLWCELSVCERVCVCVRAGRLDISGDGGGGCSVRE